MTERLVHLTLTTEEVDALAVALARSLDPESRATDAHTASDSVWNYIWGEKNRSRFALQGSLATMLAEAAGPRVHHDVLAHFLFNEMGMPNECPACKSTGEGDT